jgi:alkanesulfonate monooxygenase SsuD/methylene tetrahydromethanopterin reductase-like flavin-dependent oxidoreductase (luciferase family)
MTRYGVHAGTEGATIQHVVSYWRRVEALGYGWLSIWDHFSPMLGGGVGSFEAVASHAALACLTQGPRLGVLVYAIGYRHPAVLANAISTIDHLSGGRVEVGIGAGWHEPEHRSYGLAFEPTGARIDKLEEGVQCLAGLLHQQRFSFHGRFFEIEEATLGVRPVQQRVPLWIGGVGERRIIPLAARHADGWDAPLGPSAETFAHKVRVLERACAAIGRDPATVRRSAHVAVVGDQAELQAKFGSYAYDARPGGVLMGSDTEVLEGIRTFEAAGADQILLAGDIASGTEQLERIAGLLQLPASTSARPSEADGTLS